MNDNIDSELKKALSDADDQFRIASENLSKFSLRVRYADESMTIPASYNDEWCKRSAECQEALAALNKIVASILASR